MSLSIKINNTEKVASDLKEFTKILSEEVAFGIDNLLDMAVDDLKAELTDLVNGESEQVEINDKQNKTLDTSIPKSDSQILSELTTAKFDNLSKTKDFNTLVDNNIALIVNKESKKALTGSINTSPMSSSVNFRMNMEDYDTFDNQRARAIDYYNKSVFVFDNNGKVEYYLNPGIDLSQYVKVVCSKDGEDSPRARERFGQHKDRRGYADWTMLKTGVEVVKNKFIKLNSVIEEIKNRNYDTAETLLRKSGTGKEIDYAIEQLHNISDNKNISPQMKSYTSIVELINNLKIRKNIRDEKSTYTLISYTKEQLEEKEENFLDSIRTQIYLWKVSNEEKIIASIRKSIEKTVKRFNKTA